MCYLIVNSVSNPTTGIDKGRAWSFLVVKNALRAQGSVTLMPDICYGMMSGEECLTCHGILHSDLEGDEEASTSETRRWLLRHDSLLLVPFFAVEQGVMGVGCFRA